MNSSQAKRWLAKRGCTFTERRGKGGHIVVHRGELSTILLQHGSRKELPRGLWLAILKDLDLKEHS